MPKGERIWLDGQLVAWDAAQVHVLTHTLHYGLGVFEGIRCYECHDGRSAIFRLREHIDRLYGSAHVLDLPIPYPRSSPRAGRARAATTRRSSSTSTATSRRRAARTSSSSPRAS